MRASKRSADCGGLQSNNLGEVPPKIAFFTGLWAAPSGANRKSMIDPETL
jgi:hypothetical protein